MSSYNTFDDNGDDDNDADGIYYNPVQEEESLPVAEQRFHHQPLLYHHHHHHAEFVRPQHVYQIPQPPQQQLPPPPTNFVTAILSLFQTQGAFIAVAVALVVIVFTHYKDDVQAWFAYYFPRNVTVSDSLRVLMLQSVQYLYGWMQYLLSGALLERFLEWTQRQRSRSNDDEANHGRKEATRRVQDVLPELELVPPLPGSVVVMDLQPPLQKWMRPPKVARSMNTTELEPTFVRPEDYPTSWMVYHRVLGVVKRTEAQEYDRQNRQEQSESSTQDDECLDEDEEEKKDEPEIKSAETMDDEQTVHHSNVSPRRKKKSSPDDSSSSSENNNSTHPDFPVLHSIAAGG